MSANVDFGAPLDMHQLEILNAVFQNLMVAPGSPVVGQFYFDTVVGELQVWDGLVWISLGTGSTNLAATLSATQTIITSDTGSDATIPAADTTNAGVMTKAMFDKLAGIEALADVTDATNVNAAGAVMTADTSLAGTSFFLDEDNMGSNSATQVPSQQSVKAYVDNSLDGRLWKQPVVAATTANGTLATAFENGDTVDGVVLATGNRILIKDQTAPAENGIYVVNASGAPTRSADADAGAEFPNAAVFVGQGTANGDTQWVCTNNTPPTLGSTAIAFVLSGTSSVANASTTVAGKVELATQAEAEARTDTARATTPASLANFKRSTETLIGDGVATQFVIPHGMGNEMLAVAVYDDSTGSEVYPGKDVDTTNVTIDFGNPPSTNEYRVVIVG